MPPCVPFAILTGWYVLEDALISPVPLPFG